MTLHALNDLLARHGLALPNLGDIDAQTVAGAISTGTHGTGAGYGCLSTFVDGADPGHRHRRGAALLRRRAPRRLRRRPGRRSARSASLVEVTLRCVDAFVLRAHERPAAAGRRPRRAARR